MPTVDALLVVKCLLEHINIEPDTCYGTTDYFLYEKIPTNIDNLKQFIFKLQRHHTFTIQP